MPPRRAQRSAASRAAQEVADTPSSRSRVTRGTQAKQEVDTDQDEDAIGEDDDADMEVEAGPSRRSRAAKSRAQPSRSRNTRGRAAPVEEDEDAEGEDVDEDEEEDLPPPSPSKRTRTRKSVSYKEIPVEVEEDAEGEDDEDAEGEDDDGDEEEDTVPVRRPSRAASTPGKTRQTGEEKPAKPVFEKIGTGRGGFSVKGAAAAAARARWAKVRAERAERGEDWDERPKRKSGASGARNRPTKASDETTEIGSTFSIKGQVYEVGDDELILPDNEKGEAKVDALGRLQGGREYKVVTFTSDTRRNPERVYALTIDAARACGYTDSLAFLRRCPQLIKLACNNSERDLLIDMGRVSGNLRNRTVTMVAMRNVFKLMGARVVKNGKWVTDDYDEEEALVKCAENNFTPYGMAHEEEIMANAISTLNPPGRPSTATAGLGVEAAYFASRQNVSFTPFYTLGGPTTHFGGNGLDPFSGAGWGNKRARMRTIGTDEENWMLKLAEESRMMDARLREFRQERLVELEGEDATRGWVYALERTTEEDVNGGRGNLDALRMPGLHPPTMERKRSGLSREVSLPFKGLDDGEDDALTPLPQEAGDDDAMAGSEGGLDQSAMKDYTTPGGRIIVQSEQEAIRDQSRYNWGLGSWTAGTIKAAYEPHTQMPHIPQYTQPQLWTREQTSVYPVLSSLSDPSRRNFVQSTVTGPAAQGLASVEYVFEPQAYFAQSTGDSPDGTKRRLDTAEDALEWERQSRRKQRQ